jgi:hypothetical protein
MVSGAPNSLSKLLIWFIFFPSVLFLLQASGSFEQAGLLAILHLSAANEISITDREAVFYELPKFNFLYTFLFSVVGGRTHYLARTAPLGLNRPSTPEGQAAAGTTLNSRIQPGNMLSAKSRYGQPGQPPRPDPSPTLQPRS